LPYLLALFSAACFGAADFMGGLASRRAHVFAVVVVSGAAGLATIVALIGVMPAASPTHADLSWGMVAGLTGGIGLGLLLRALAIGTMSVVAPTTALCGVAIPVMAGLAFGDRPSMSTSAGMVLALVAIVLVSQEGREDGPEPRVRSRGLGIALLSGVAIGFFYLALAETSRDAGLWPLLAARATSVTLYTLAAFALGHSLRVASPVARLVVASGVLDMGANALYLLSTRGGPLSVVVVLSSLYPAGTVLLARLVLKERLSAMQIAGVICAMIAVALIVGGA
jgi:uncharacterized membrane protein